MNKHKLTFRNIVDFLDSRGCFHFLSDSAYLKMMYMIRMHKRLHLSDPKTFNEKLQWLKLHDRRPEYTMMVDKYEVKKYVAEKIGAEYIIPTLGVWDRFEDIDFDMLPNQFVLKCTHDSGGLVVCTDKSRLDIEYARNKINKCLKRNYFWMGREWPYKDVKPRIIAEKYMTEAAEGSLADRDLPDYKIHCFNGEPKMILVCRDRFKQSGLTEDFFDTEWNHYKITRPGHPNAVNKIERPNTLQQMLKLSEELSRGIPFARIDFYEIRNHVFFGEITFFPATGMEKYEPEEWDLKIGDLLKLPGQGI